MTDLPEVYITLKLGETSVTLSPAEAKALLDLLDSLVGEKRAEVNYIVRDWPWSWAPYYQVSLGQSTGPVTIPGLEVTWGSTYESEFAGGNYEQ